MVFLSAEFLLFFALVFLFHLFLPHRWRNSLLLVASLLFFASWGAASLGMVIALGGVGFYAGRRIGTAPERARSAWLWGAAAFVVAGILTSRLVLSPARGVVALPLGVSFYGLQVFGYLFERRRGGSEAGFLDFLLFTSFFPTATMGPIERFEKMGPQIRGERHLGGAAVAEGVLLVIFGAFKKMVIADRLALLGKEFFAGGTKMNLPEAALFLYLAFFCFYADFSGYTDIARGLARLLGFETTLNFRQPYWARDLGDFLNRWHVSLIGWMKDFVFWPLALRTRSLPLAAAGTFAALSVWHGLHWSRWLISLYLLLLYLAFLGVRRIGPARPMAEQGLARRALASAVVVLLVSLSFAIGGAFKMNIADIFLPLSSGWGGIAFLAGHGTDFSLVVGAAILMIFLDGRWPRSMGAQVGWSFLLLFASIAVGVTDSLYFLYMRY